MNPIIANMQQNVPSPVSKNMQLSHQGLVFYHEFPNREQGTKKDTESLWAHANWTIIGAVVILISIIAGGLLLFALPRSRPQALGDAGKRLCFAEDCLAVASVLLTSMNRSVDPCANFYQFVCGNWKAVAPDGASNVLDSMRLQAIRKAQDLLDKLEVVGYADSAVEKVVMLYDSCTNTLKGDVDAIGELRQFMNGRRLPWPKKPPPGVDPFEVLVDLTLNWMIGVWFCVRYERGHNGSSNTIHISEGFIDQEWWAFLKDIRVNTFNSYLSYVREYFGYLSDENRNSLSLQNISELSAVEMEIAEVIARTSAPPDERNKWVRLELGKVEEVTPNIPYEKWVSVLGEAAGPRANFTARGKVHVSNIGLAKVVGPLLSRYTSSLLLDVIGWTVVQYMGWMGDSSFAFLRFGNKSNIERSGTTLCFMMLENIYGLAAAATLYATYFPLTTRRVVDAVLNEVSSANMELLQNVPWLSYLHKPMEIFKFSRTKCLLWPPQDVSTIELDKLYSKFPNRTSTLLQHLVGCSMAFKKVWTENPQRAYPYRPLHWEPGYDALHGQFILPLWLLFPPIFSVDVIQGLNYGGIGMLYASLAARSLDALEVDGEAWAIRAQCFESSSRTYETVPHRKSLRGEVLWKSLAVATAWRAFNEQPTDHRILFRLEDFKDHHLFFLATCFQLCGSATDRMREAQCNVALRNFAPFARTFNCPNGSRMNPVHKCEFW